MGAGRFIFWIIIIYLLYRFIYNFIIPVAKTTSHIKSSMNDMRRMQEEQLRKQQETAAQQQKQEETKTVDKGDYIDFEEIK